MSTYAVNELVNVAARYNPENDLIPDAPSVTYTDHILIEVVKELLMRVQALEEQFDAQDERDTRASILRDMRRL